MGDWKTRAAGQHNVISRGQLIAEGLNADQIRRLLRTGVLEIALPRVYRVVGSQQDWHQRLMQACLWGGPGAVASFRSAAVLHKFGGFTAAGIEICVARTRRLRPDPKNSRPRFKVHRWDVDPTQTTTIDGIPVTNAHRTLRDLLPTLKADYADRVLDDALRRGLVSVASLRSFVLEEKGSGHRGIRRMRQIMNERDPNYRPSASEMNTLIRQTLKAHGITDFVEEFDMYDEDGTFIGRADIGFPGGTTVIEGQSRLHHSNKEDFERDMERRTKAALAGYTMIEVSWRVIVETPEVFIAQVKRAREAEKRSRRAS